MTLLKTVTRLSVDKGAAKSGIDICYGTTRIWRYRFGLTPAPGVNRTRVQTMRAFTHSP